MQVTVFTLLMSMAWGSILALFIYLCRKKQFFIRQFGIGSILFLYICTFIRMAVPYEFPFTRVIGDEKFLARFYKRIYLDARDAGKISILAVFVIIWVFVAVVLSARFILGYVRAMKEISLYSVCEDEQCRKIFAQVVSEGKKERKIAVRRSHQASTPMGIGIFKKSIVLPDEEYSDSELYYILRHEYMHFENHDLYIKMLVHGFCCIFWWNPLLCLLKKDLAQTLEIKCDMKVTEGMDYGEKAQYLAVIVSTLKKLKECPKGKPFYGTAALVSKDYQSETVERFQFVSGDYNRKKNVVLTAACFLAVLLLLTVSYSFVFQAAYEVPIEEIVTGPESNELTPENSYLIKKKNGTYIWVYQGDGDEIEEEQALYLLSDGFKVIEEGKE